VKTKADSRKRDLARIHILKAALALDRAIYEDILWVQGRVESSASLDEHGRKMVISHMEATLARQHPQHPVLARARRRPHNADTSKRKELQKIEGLLTDAGLPWAYAEAMAKRMYRKERLAFCGGGELVGIVSALHNAALKRLHAEWHAEAGDGWEIEAARVAAHCFGFDARNQNVERYPEPMSLALRWRRGLIPSCVCLPLHSHRGQLAPAEVALGQPVGKWGRPA
jgi:phage gp16-like protein